MFLEGDTDSLFPHNSCYDKDKKDWQRNDDKLFDI